MWSTRYDLTFDCLSILVFLLSHLTNFSYRRAWRLCVNWNVLSSTLYVADSYLATRFNANAPSLENPSLIPKGTPLIYPF